MRFRPRTWLLLSLLLFAAAYWVWTYAEKVSASRRARAAQSAAVQPPGPRLAKIARPSIRPSQVLPPQQHPADREAVARSNHAIILRNALIDTTVR
jgi:cbb3-type cytochrome oxidase subunit 3